MRKQPFGLTRRKAIHANRPSIFFANDLNPVELLIISDMLSLRCDTYSAIRVPVPAGLNQDSIWFAAPTHEIILASSRRKSCLTCDISILQVEALPSGKAGVGSAAVGPDYDFTITALVYGRFLHLFFRRSFQLAHLFIGRSGQWPVLLIVHLVACNDHVRSISVLQRMPFYKLSVPDILQLVRAI